MRSIVVALLACGLVAHAFAAAPIARAQDVATPIADEAPIAVEAVSVAPELDATRMAWLDEAHADRLADLRLRHRQARIDEGIGLLVFGLASAVAGGAIAIAGSAASPEDTRWLSIGVATAGWGVINAVFSVFLFDLGDRNLQRIEADRGLRGQALDHAREDAARAQYDTATLIAVNAGLDVFYMALGILLFVIGDQAQPDDQWVQGFGIASAAQGVGLFAYDVSTWIAAAGRGDETRMLFRDEDEVVEE